MPCWPAILIMPRFIVCLTPLPNGLEQVAEHAIGGPPKAGFVDQSEAVGCQGDERQDGDGVHGKTLQVGWK